MPIDTGELMQAVAVLSEQENLKVCVTESLKGGLWVGGAAAIGSIILGPVGLAIGGAAGGITAAYCNQGKYKSAAEIILNDMTRTQQLQLQGHIMTALQNFDITDLTFLLPLLLNNASAQKLVLEAVTGYLTKEMGLKIQN